MFVLLSVVLCLSVAAAAPSDALSSSAAVQAAVQAGGRAGGQGAEPIVEQFTDLPPTPPEPSTEPPEPGCPPCKPSRCPHTAMECSAGAGLTTDPCGCCERGVCGQPEGARCFNATTETELAVRSVGVCGENMDCLLRHDLSEMDKPEALCVCRDQGQVCGSDNTTYPSSCQMKPKRMPSKDEPPTRVYLKHRGPCRAAPWIVTPPSAVSYVAGSPVSLECEVKGYPTPVPSWEKIGKDGILTTLPSDNSELVVMMRGGPEPFMSTSWLQIMALDQEDVGTYICVATNSEGVSRAAAEVSLL